jgi:hypothetical protein
MRAGADTDTAATRATIPAITPTVPPSPDIMATVLATTAMPPTPAITAMLATVRATTAAASMVRAGVGADGDAGDPGAEGDNHDTTRMSAIVAELNP